MIIYIKKYHFVLWDIDDDDLMHYLTRKDMCKEVYKYLLEKKALIPSYWLAL